MLFSVQDPSQGIHRSNERERLGAASLHNALPPKARSSTC